MSPDAQHLKLLSIFYYIFGGISAVFSCIPMIYLGFGIAIVISQFPFPDNNGPPPEIFGWFIIVFSAIFMAFCWAYTICLLMTGRCLQQRRGYTFCFVVSALSCLSMPFGTCLGIFTIIVLLRPSVTELFENPQATELTSDSTGPEQPQSDPSRSDSSSQF